MNIEIRKTAYKDLDKVSRTAAIAIDAVIMAIVEAESITEIRNIKKLKVHRTAYRIRTGNYRIGIILENDTVVIVRVLSRKDIYKYFP